MLMVQSDGGERLDLLCFGLVCLRQGLSITGWPGIHCVAQADLKTTILHYPAEN